MRRAERKTGSKWPVSHFNTGRFKPQIIITMSNVPLYVAAAPLEACGGVDTGLRS